MIGNAISDVSIVLPVLPTSVSPPLIPPPNFSKHFQNPSNPLHPQAPKLSWALRDTQEKGAVANMAQSNLHRKQTTTPSSNLHSPSQPLSSQSPSTTSPPSPFICTTLYTSLTNFRTRMKPIWMGTKMDRTTTSAAAATSEEATSAGISRELDVDGDPPQFAQSWLSKPIVIEYPCLCPFSAKARYLAVHVRDACSVPCSCTSTSLTRSLCALYQLLLPQFGKLLPRNL